MPKKITFEGATHVFPDDFSDEEISLALQSMHPLASDKSIPQVTDVYKTPKETDGGSEPAAEPTAALAVGPALSLAAIVLDLLSML